LTHGCLGGAKTGWGVKFAVMEGRHLVWCSPTSVASAAARAGLDKTQQIWLPASPTALRVPDATMTRLNAISHHQKIYTNPSCKKKWKWRHQMIASPSPIVCKGHSAARLGEVDNRLGRLSKVYKLSPCCTIRNCHGPWKRVRAQGFDDKSGRTGGTSTSWH